VLSPELVVERKALPDLFSSLASGRLYHQVGAGVEKECVWGVCVGGGGWLVGEMRGLVCWPRGSVGAGG
jgi:hypothetical protein